ERSVCPGFPVRVSLRLGFTKATNPTQVEVCDVDAFFGVRLDDGRVDRCAVLIPRVADRVEGDRMTALLWRGVVGLSDRGHVLDAARTQTDAMVLVVSRGVRNQDQLGSLQHQRPCSL